MTPTVLPAMTILYVADIEASVAFYAARLGLAPVEQSPGFAMFAVPGGSGLGLWRRTDVVPVAAESSGGSELCCPVGTADALHALHRAWSQAGVTIAQSPEAMDFGETFTALDPDGHRLRVFVPVAS